MPRKKKNPTFESAMEDLESTVRKLEGDHLSLEESLNLFETGIKLSRYCASQLDEAQVRVKKLMDEGDKLEDFDPADA